MAGTRVGSMQSAVSRPPPVPPQRSDSSQEPVQLRIKTCQSSTDRLSQSRSLVLQDSDLPQKPISRHRRNKSQHNVASSGAAMLEPLVDLDGETLNVAKICDGGKKQRKNWTSMWSVLTAQQLLLCKDRQEAALRAGGKAEAVPLSGAELQWSTEKSSRKNVFQVSTTRGSQYLLQADSFSSASRWFAAIRKSVDASTSGEREFPLRRSSSTEHLPRHGSLPAYGSAGTKPPNPVHRRSINLFTSGRLKHSASDSADKNGVKNRLKKFISRRPSMKTLQEKGLIQDRVFGCDLLALCQREGSTVPAFVRTCVDAVEKRGLQVDGIYRVSGNLATVQKLRFIVDQEEQLDLAQTQWEDVHVVTGALKLFFRELPEPLFPCRLFQRLLQAIRLKDAADRVQTVKSLVEDLPKPNQDTMRVLFRHLHRVLAFSKQNLMSLQGLGIVFGPTLMWAERDAANMALNMAYQNQVVEFVLSESPRIFSLDGE